jgi:2-polyprenyl-6-methoxyphenol hydroxylase-like FAD-dependent oxidoreductase
VSAHFVADMSHLPDGILWFILDPRSGLSTFISYDKAKEWVYTIRYDPKVNPAESWLDETVRERIEEAMGYKIQYKIQSILKWNTFPKLAKTYRSQKVQNAFLPGDAAHAFPPTSSLGVNIGIGDAQNLA